MALYIVTTWEFTNVMEHTFEKNVINFIKSKALLKDGDRVIAAVSGGADSVALLEILHRIKQEKTFDIELLCVHINHCLRGESADRDENFVKELAEQTGVAFISKSVNVTEFAESEKLSIETAARKLRIRSLLEAAENNNCNIIAAGHHKDDNAETILQRLERGTGLRGLTGIWEKRKADNNIDIIRPLLGVKRKEIVNYLEYKKLKWCRDHTNSDITYNRNFIRHLLIPRIEEDFKGDLTEKLTRLGQGCKKLYAKTNAAAKKRWEKQAVKKGNRVMINISAFCNCNPEIPAELSRIAIHKLGGGEQGLKQQHYKQIMHLAEKETGKMVNLPCRITVYRDYENIIFTRQKSGEKAVPDDKVIELKIPGVTNFGEFSIKTEIISGGLDRIKNKKSENVEYFDFDKLKLPITARKRKKGDRFVPLGYKTPQKVSKFLTNQKISRTIRGKILMICDKNRIIWVCPVRISEKTRADKNTKRLLKANIDSISG